MFFAFNMEKSEVEARQMIVETYGEASIKENNFRDDFNATIVVILTWKIRSFSDR